MGDDTIRDFDEVNDTIRLLGFTGIASDSEAFEGHTVTNNILTLNFGSEGSLTSTRSAARQSWRVCLTGPDRQATAYGRSCDEI